MIASFNVALVAAILSAGRARVSSGRGEDGECTSIQAAMATLGGTSCGADYIQTKCGNSPKPPDTTKPKHTTKPTTGPTSPNPPPNPPLTDEPFIGTYYPNWFVYDKIYMGVDAVKRGGAGGTPDNQYTVWPSSLPKVLSKVNTIYYAFWNLNADCMPIEPDKQAAWEGANWIQVPDKACTGATNDLLSVKTQYPHLKIMVSIGGWSYSQDFSRCLKSEDSYQKIWDVLKYYLADDFGREDSLWAGVDLDWEHPEAAGYTENYSSDDWDNYAKLVTWLRAKAEKEGRTAFYLTSAVGVGDTFEALLKKPDVAKQFCDSVDHINFMTYDLHGKWEPVTGHNAQFCQIDDTPDARPAPRELPWSVVDRVNAFLTICPASKLAIGIPNYTPAWSDVPEGDSNGLYQSSTAKVNVRRIVETVNPWALWSTFSFDDKTFQSQGVVHWWDLKAALENSANGFQVYQKVCPSADGVEVPVKWVYSADKQLFACYEDEETVQKKAEWAKVKGLAGIFFWDISQDKAGDLVQAARKGWGVTEEHPKQGKRQCYDDRAPDFENLLPDGTKNPWAAICQTWGMYTARIVSGNTCDSLKAAANEKCPKQDAVVVGGNRNGKCYKPCLSDFSDNSPWASDVMYYDCMSTYSPDNRDPTIPKCYAYNAWYNGECKLCSAPNDGVTSCPEFGTTRCYKTLDECKQGTP